MACDHNGASKSQRVVSIETMNTVFETVRTPHKYGIVLAPPDSTKMVDSPTIFRVDNTWYMTYIVFDGKGYETWLAESADLLHWDTKGRILSFTDTTWDASQKAGYVSLIDIEWGGTYQPRQQNGRYWLSYLGGSSQGYEAGQLGIGLASTEDITEPLEWTRNPTPILSASDADARWYDNLTIYKSLIIEDTEGVTGHPYLMYYNAKGREKDANGEGFESIAMAVSDDLENWKRYGEQPLITMHQGICGDAQITKINDLYVMFYFGAFWRPGAFERFACSYDLIHWTPWEGEDLIAPSEPYDKQFAHKPWVIKWNDVVYHFYNAVGDQGRVIVLATSKDLRTDTTLEP
ncbi:hypothetical protein GCM10011386_17920 [Parapedobacter defluvii]|uniref:Glycosylase n=2 Tax=Parapedobacter defluvii TaxID=2045106 RepID=A0ABQ1LLE7_9SPHI|nr:hypothetical protein GCM10011386_17920 [Parapedobacter defluvii]